MRHFRWLHSLYLALCTPVVHDKVNFRKHFCNIFKDSVIRIPLETQNFKQSRCSIFFNHDRNTISGFSSLAQFKCLLQSIVFFYHWGSKITSDVLQVEILVCSYLLKTLCCSSSLSFKRTNIRNTHDSMFNSRACRYM